MFHRQGWDPVDGTLSVMQHEDSRRGMGPDGLSMGMGLSGSSDWLIDPKLEAELLELRRGIQWGFDLGEQTWTDEEIVQEPKRMYMLRDRHIVLRPDQPWPFEPLG